jgi:hypothetical protein
MILGVGDRVRRDAEIVRRMQLLDDETVVKDDSGKRKTRDIVDYIGEEERPGNKELACEPMTRTRGHAPPGIRQKATSVWSIPTIYVDCESERWQEKEKKRAGLGTKPRL